MSLFETFSPVLTSPFSPNNLAKLMREDHGIELDYWIREDGVYIVLDAASKAKIYESEIVSEIGDIKVSSDYKTLSVTATIKGNVENCDLTRGG